jgi:hypothetical protein
MDRITAFLDTPSEDGVIAVVAHHGEAGGSAFADTVKAVSGLRKYQQRIIHVTANTSGRDLGSIATEIEKKISEMKIPEGFAVSLKGSRLEQQEAFRMLLFALALAILLVYMVLASQFGSLLHPFRELGHFFIFDLFSVHSDPFIESDEMGRRIEAHPVTFLLKHRSHHRGRGPFAVRPSDVNGLDGSMGILIAMLSMAIVLFLMVLTAFMYIDILGAKAEVREIAGIDLIEREESSVPDIVVRGVRRQRAWFIPACVDNHMVRETIGTRHPGAQTVMNHEISLA